MYYSKDNIVETKFEFSKNYTIHLGKGFGEGTVWVWVNRRLGILAVTQCFAKLVSEINEICFAKSWGFKVTSSI